MTAPRTKPEGVKGAEKRRLDEALEEGAGRDLSGFRSGQRHPAAALERRPSRQAQGLAPNRARVREPAVIRGAVALFR